MQGPEPWPSVTDTQDGRRSTSNITHVQKRGVRGSLKPERGEKLTGVGGPLFRDEQEQQRCKDLGRVFRARSRQHRAELAASQAPERSADRFSERKRVLIMRMT